MSKGVMVSKGETCLNNYKDSEIFYRAEALTYLCMLESSAFIIRTKTDTRL